MTDRDCKSKPAPPLSPPSRSLQWRIGNAKAGSRLSAIFRISVHKSSCLSLPCVRLCETRATGLFHCRATSLQHYQHDDGVPCPWFWAGPHTWLWDPPRPVSDRAKTEERPQRTYMNTRLRFRLWCSQPILVCVVRLHPLVNLSFPPSSLATTHRNVSPNMGNLFLQRSGPLWYLCFSLHAVLVYGLSTYISTT